jgi:hypothetical protein
MALIEVEQDLVVSSRVTSIICSNEHENVFFHPVGAPYLLVIARIENGSPVYIRFTFIASRNECRQKLFIGGQSVMGDLRLGRPLKPGG